MSFFKKLFGKPDNAATTRSTQGNKEQSPTAITLLFPQLPRYEASKPVLWTDGVSLPLEFEIIIEGQESLVNLKFGAHHLKLVGFSAPMPEQVRQNTIHFSNWPDQAKQIMYGHQAHLICYYEWGTEDPAEQLLALYKVAAAFSDQGLLGVADETAMTANPSDLVEELFGPMPLEAVLNDHDLPYLAWVGVLKLFKPDGNIWWVSRGHERFGVPDMAHLTPVGEGERVMDLFSNLLNYMYFYQARIEAGHTAEIGEAQLQFDEPDEYREYIETPTNPALVVTITNR
jgi:hypothetical protein